MEIVKDPPFMPQLEKIVEKKIKTDILDYQKNRNKYYKIIEEFIQKNNGKIFGNMTYLRYLKNTLPLGIKEYYYSCFVKKPKKLAIELSNILFNEKLFLVECSRNYDNSYTVKYEGQICCIFYPVGEIDYNTLEIIKYKSNISKKELMFVSPEILNIMILKKICNPRIYISEWEYLYDILDKSSFNKTSVLSSSLPRKIDQNMLIGFKPKYSNIITELFNFTKNNDILVTGIAGYLQFMSKSSKKKYFKPRLNVYELLSKNPLQDLKKIKEYLVNKLNLKESEFRDRKIISFIGIHPDKYSLYYSNIKIIDLYDISQEYVPYTIIEYSKYGNLDLLKRFLLTGIYVSNKIKGGDILRQKNTLMILELINSDIPDEISKPFEIKQLFGNIVLPDRQYKIRKFQGKEIFFIYKPELYFRKFNKLLN